MLKKYFCWFCISANIYVCSDWWIYTYEDVSTLKVVLIILVMVKSDSCYMKIINTVLIGTYIYNNI